MAPQLVNPMLAHFSFPESASVLVRSHPSRLIPHLQVASFLIDAGADVAWPDKDGYSALHMAAGYVHSPVVQALLAAGADPEQEDKSGRSPLSLVQGLLEKTPANNPLQVGDAIEGEGGREGRVTGL